MIIAPDVVVTTLRLFGILGMVVPSTVARTAAMSLKSMTICSVTTPPGVGRMPSTRIKKGGS